MYRTYILFSVLRNKFYIGHTGQTLEERLKKHCCNHKGFTGSAPDWEIVYFENYLSKPEAQRRELEIKKWKSRKMIERLIANSSVG